jgi:hypothetical protein
MTYFEWAVLFFLFMILVALNNLTSIENMLTKSDRKMTRRLEGVIYVLVGEDKERKSKINSEIMEWRKTEEGGEPYTDSREHIEFKKLMIMGAVLVLIIPFLLITFPHVMPYIRDAYTYVNQSL